MQLGLQQNNSLTSKIISSPKPNLSSFNDKNQNGQSIFNKNYQFQSKQKNLLPKYQFQNVQSLNNTIPRIKLSQKQLNNNFSQKILQNQETRLTTKQQQIIYQIQRPKYQKKYYHQEYQGKPLSLESDPLQSSNQCCKNNLWWILLAILGIILITIGIIFGLQLLQNSFDNTDPIKIGITDYRYPKGSPQDLAGIHTNKVDLKNRQSFLLNHTYRLHHIKSKE